MSSPEPRGRMFQDDEFSVEDLVGSLVEKLLGIVADPARGPSLFVMKLAGHYWQQFFLDAGIAFWEEWPDEVIEKDLEDDIVVDLAAMHQLTGQTIRRVTCVQGPQLRIALSSGVLSFRAADPQDLEAATVIEFSGGA